jgi:FlaG/FlaF family flagellin (archaellin)
MYANKFFLKKHQRGMSIVGLILMLALIGLVFVLAAKITPTVIEYMSIKKAIQTAKASGNTIKEIQTAFDKQAEVGYIDSINGRDLSIVKDGDGYAVSFSYTKKITLVGPASLLMEYEGTTAKSGSAIKKP